MGISYALKDELYIETGPKSPRCNGDLYGKLISNYEISEVLRYYSINFILHHIKLLAVKMINCKIYCYRTWRITQRHYTPRRWSWGVCSPNAGFTLSAHPSICSRNCVRSVSSTILAGVTSCLQVLSTNFRRLGLCWVFEQKLIFTEVLLHYLANHILASSGCQDM